MLITVYHGSDREVKKPLTNVGRKNLDFGQGFYLTNMKTEADLWAKKVSDSKDTKPIVSVYNFDYFRAKNIGYRFNEFETYNIEWLKFVVDCRNGKNVLSYYDIVIGAAVNEQVVNIIEDYEKGIITAEQAVEQLRCKEVKHQICILNQEIIDFCLEFVESHETIDD